MSASAAIGDPLILCAKRRIPIMKKNLSMSSGNISVDLGFDPAEATVLQMWANLRIDIRLYIENHKLTQSDAAKRLGIAQSRVSDLVCGKWDKLGLKMLITLEARIGRSVTIRAGFPQRNS